MTHQRFYSILTLLFATVIAAVAQDVSFTLVQPRNVIEGRRFSITYRLANGQANAPSAPELNGCRALLPNAQVSTMSSTEIVNGRMTSSMMIDFTYIYLAEKAGTVQVPALSVNVGGKTYTSKSASFTILPPDNAGGASGGQQGKPGRQVVPDDVSTQTPGNVSSDDLLVRVSFSKSRVLEQEPVIATIKVYTKYRITSYMPTTQPTFEGCLSEDLPVSGEMELENYNGQNYYAAVVKRVLLYPQKAGTIKVNSGQYDITIEQYELVNTGFWTTRRPVERKVTTKSNAATLQVEALPQPQPVGFTGAVGSYTVSTSLEPEPLKTNEAATYTYTVRGTGNIKYLHEPEVNFPAGIDTYTPKTEIDANFNGQTYRGTYTVEYTIVPQEVGRVAIESPEFVYFDLDKRQYVTLTPESFEANVARGASTSTVVEQRSIDKTIDDIRHIRPTGQLDKEPTFIFHSWIYWMTYVVAVVALITVIILYRRRLRQLADIKGRKLARAGRVAQRRLRQARALMKSGSDDAFYAEIARALWGYVSDRLGIAPSGLTRDNIAEQLTQRGADQSAVDAVIDVLDQCEMARFTPQHSREEIATLYDKAAEAIGSLENLTKNATR